MGDQQPPVDPAGKDVPTGDDVRKHADNLANNIKDEAQQQASDAVQEVLETVGDAIEDQTGIDLHLEEINSWKGLWASLRETGAGLANAFVGDFKLFWAIVRTVAVWFVKPLSLDVVQLLEERKANPSGDGRYRYFTDFALIRSIFGLSLLFLVVEEVALEDQKMEEYISQFVFLLFYVALMFAFILGGWIWFKIMRVKGRNVRRFIGFLLYQFATIYMLSFITLVVVKVPEESDWHWALSWIFPWAHTMYFIWRLCGYYELTGAKRFMALSSAFLGIGFFTLVAPAVQSATLGGSAGASDAPAAVDSLRDALALPADTAFFGAP